MSLPTSYPEGELDLCQVNNFHRLPHIEHEYFTTVTDDGLAKPVELLLESS